MRNKSIFLLLACVCGTVAAIGVSQWMQAQSSTPSPLAMVEIFVTTKTIDIAEQITPEKIRLEQWPADRVPQGASGELADLEGKFARQRFYEGEPVMPVKLMDDANGSSQSIPVGFSVVSMKADPESSVASLVRPGDRVDVMAYFTKGELIPESTAKTVLTGVRVFAVDGSTERDVAPDDTKPAKTISLLVDKQDVPAWISANELGNLRLTLGNPGDVTEPTAGENGSGAGQAFLQWLADHQAAQAARRDQEQAQPVTASRPANLVSRQTVAAKKGFTMWKMSGGVLTEYWIEDGTRVPVVVTEGGSEQPSSSTPVTRPDAESGDHVPSAPSDYSYLNGSQSPFFQPPPGRSPGDYNDLIGDEED